MEILRAIMEWLNRPITDESSPVYWVNGLAGIGKSTIARTVAKQAKVPVASYFFVRQHDELSNANLFVASIARAVAEIFPDFMKSVYCALQTDELLPRKSLDTQFTSLFFQPLQNLTLTQPLLLVVDALDECEQKGAQIILITFFPTAPRYLLYAYSLQAGQKTTSLLSSKGLIIPGK